ncbi:MAG TPA: lipocalin-like domain-containing protein [Terriglobia bacterium]|nr:lipocalin-like domain-containing protein [Terriglobia bacterium]
MKFCFAVFLFLAAGPGQFRFATPGYHFQFPRDYFNHPDYQTEWWYYSGNLTTRQGRAFGFELALFRLGVAPGPRKRVWQVNDVYMAHVALSDLSGGHFLYDERVNRAGPGIAGVSQRQGRVWNGNWQIQWRGDNQQLQAVTDEFSLDLTLEPEKPLVLNGRKGFSQKAPGAGNASNYFSFTRLETKGKIELRGRQYQVTGTSWMDHEFSTTPKDSPVAGWDWLAIQLNNCTELMLYRVRLDGGVVSPDSSGTYTDAKGTGHYLSIHDFRLIPGESWISPRSHARYPVGWRIAIPSIQLRLQITTPLKQQELVTNNSYSPTYWEGAIRISGEQAGKAVEGVGYLEMTGYAKRLDSDAK